jgi:transposase-like protein
MPARIVREANKPIAQVAADLGINPGTLGNWVNQDKIDRGEAERLSSDERAELARLRAENAELRMERGLLGYATSAHADAELAGQTLTMAVTTRGGKDQVAGVIFHSDRGSTYTAHHFTQPLRQLGITQSMGRTGSCFDNAAAEHSSPPWNTRCSPGISSKLARKHNRPL